MSACHSGNSSNDWAFSHGKGFSRSAARTGCTSAYASSAALKENRICEVASDLTYSIYQKMQIRERICMMGVIRLRITPITRICERHYRSIAKSSLSMARMAHPLIERGSFDIGMFAFQVHIESIPDSRIEKGFMQAEAPKIRTYRTSIAALSRFAREASLLHRQASLSGLISSDKHVNRLIAKK